MTDDCIFCEFAHTVGKLDGFLERTVLWEILRNRGVKAEDLVALQKNLSALRQVFYESEEVKKK